MGGLRLTNLEPRLRLKSYMLSPGNARNHNVAPSLTPVQLDVVHYSLIWIYPTGPQVFLSIHLLVLCCVLRLNFLLPLQQPSTARSLCVRLGSW